MDKKYYIARVVGKKELYFIKPVKRLENTAVVEVYALKDKKYLFKGLSKLIYLDKYIYLKKKNSIKYFI